MARTVSELGRPAVVSAGLMLAAGILYAGGPTYARHTRTRGGGELGQAPPPRLTLAVRGAAITPVRTAVVEDPLAGLWALVASDEFDEECLAPTAHAVAQARDLISQAYTLAIARGAPLPAFSTIGDGSVYVRWRRAKREVSILVPPTDAVPIRLYYVQGSKDGAESFVTPEALAARLAWLHRG